jgi:hypothetical protein
LNAKGEVGFEWRTDRTCARLRAHKHWEARNRLANAACLSQHNRQTVVQVIGDGVATDRPDVTNSTVVVPAGSLQIENGINVNARDGDRFLDGTNTRFRAETRLQRSAINA